MTLRLLLLVVLLGCLATPSSAAPPDFARFGLPVERLDLTPSGAATLLERECLPALYSTPVRLLPDGTVAPLAALQVLRDPEGTQYRLVLHPALRWSDGTPVTPEQVIAGWEDTIQRHALHAPAFSPVRGYDSFIAGASPHLSGLGVAEDGTLAITLKQSDLRFAPWLADSTWSLCKGAIQTLNVGDVSVRVRAGTGPYYATTLVGRTLTLVANANQFEGRPLMPEWRWELLGSGEAVTRAYLAGRLDAAPAAPTQWTTFLGQSSWRGHTSEHPSTSTLGLVVNPRSTLLGSNRATRLSLLQAPNFATLRTITLAGTIEPTRGHFADRLGLPPPPGPGEGIGGAAGTLLLAYPSEQPELLPLANRIAAEVSSGVGGWKITPVPRRTSELKSGTGGSWDVALWLLPGPVQPALAEGAEFTALWSRWGKGVDPMARPWDLESELIAQGWWRPIGHPHALWLASPRLGGFLDAPGWAPVWADTRWER